MHVNPKFWALAVALATAPLSVLSAPVGTEDINVRVNTRDTSACKGYSVNNVRKTDRGLTAKLSMIGTPCNVYGKDRTELDLVVEYQARDRLSVHIRDSVQENYFVPPSIVRRPTFESMSGPSNLNFSYTVSPFTFKVTRVEDGEVIFDTTRFRFVYEDSYISVTSEVPKNAVVYGGSEVVGPLRRDARNTTMAIFATDVGNPIEMNQYGSHPMYTELRHGKAHAVYLRNTVPMDFILRDGIAGFRALGGTADLFFFAPPGGNPNDVVASYTKAVGTPMMPAYWTLGFHQCRWGYYNLANVKWVYDRYREADIPLETVWGDIDFMDKYRAFTVDPDRYPAADYQDFISSLHASHQHYIPILDPGMSTNSTPYTRGLAKNVYIHRAPEYKTDPLYIGHVWPGYVAYPDWMHPNTTEWWTGEVERFRELIAFDGLWLDMQEPATFCVGSCGTGAPDPAKFQPNPPFDFPGGQLYYPPDFAEAYNKSLQAGKPLMYSDGKPLPPLKPDFDKREMRVIGKRAYKPRPAEDQWVPKYAINHVYGDVQSKTVQLNATQFGGVAMIDSHNIYGHMEALATTAAYRRLTPNKRHFTLSRSTFASGGNTTFHWTGDNGATWPHFQYSLAAIQQFQLFGFSLIGSDLCGFWDETTEELCGRWMAAGSYFPFMRNHNMRGMKSQEAYVWDSVANATRTNVRIRYSLLPYMYTHLQKSNEVGVPAWKALFMEFPTDTKTYDIDQQFLIGDGVLVSPVTTQNATTVAVYLPKTRWYDYYTHKATDSEGKTVTLPAPMGHVPIHLRGGRVYTTQTPGYTTYESRQNPYTLTIALSPARTATGTLYIDDGESLNPGSQFTKIAFTATPTSLTATGHFGYVPHNTVQTIVVLGVTSAPRGGVRVNGQKVAGAKVEFDAKVGKVTVSGVSVGLNKGWKVEWGYAY
ncbi:hypothetical protein HK104_010022 [Borealophlyctis nickersoniae]|nr:hypothetical protein HK104_010022 [Borealophlyctis nickersoniae]